MRTGLFFCLISIVCGIQAQPKISLLNSPVSTSLRGVAVVNDSVWWASGRNNTVISTKDAGKTWTRFFVGDTALKTDYRDIQVLKDGAVLAMGITRPAVIYRLPQNGSLWEQVFYSADTAVFLDAMDFWDGKEGRCLADPIAGRWPLLSTSDGGKTWFWQAAKNTPEATSEEAAFAAGGCALRTFGDSELVFVTGGLPLANFHRSINRGITWTKTISSVSGSASSGLFCPEKLADNDFIAAGGDFNAPEKASNTLDFFSKESNAAGQLNGYRCVIRKVGQNTLIATGDAGTDISIDLGKSWQKLSTEGFYTFDCAGSTCVFAGKGGKIGLMHLTSGQ